MVRAASTPHGGHRHPAVQGERPPRRTRGSRAVASSRQQPCCYDACGRTTVTLEPDIAARLQRLAVERGATFKATINATLRAGLEAGGGTPQPYREMTRDLGLQSGVDLTKALRLAAELEDEGTIRKLELRK